MHFVFLSPHLDDVALSCGGIVHSLIKQQNKVEIWTIFAGDPPPGTLSPFATSLHRRWQLMTNPTRLRRREDSNAAKVLGASFRHFTLADCIYRSGDGVTPLVNQEEDLFQEIPGNQRHTVTQVTQLLENNLTEEMNIVSPLSIGNHLDHRITRAATRALLFPSIWFFADYPYIVKADQKLKDYLPDDATEIKYALSKSDMDVWKQAIAAHRSQISTFWESEAIMMQKVDLYARNGGGQLLWKTSL